MEIQKARENVVLAGKKLLESGLIARTWGNVSCRISDYQFVITPSGRAYETLSPKEIVTVNIEDGSYCGELKPSSEKDLHAEIYKHRKDVNFIIHTHQASASALSPLGEDIPIRDSEAVSSFGGKVACAAYGLPGSQKLKREAVAALTRTAGKAILLANHGAVCLGSDMQEAFQVATDLEQLSADFACRRYSEISGESVKDADKLREDFIKLTTDGTPAEEKEPPKNLYNSERKGEHFIMYSGAKADAPFAEEEINFRDLNIIVPPDNKEADILPAEAELHRDIYRRYKDVGAIIHTRLPDIMAVSRAGRNLTPLLDDFAQIIGTSARVVAYNGSAQSIKDVSGKLKGKSAVLIRGQGALCTGPNKYDAAAAVMVLDKGCKAMICSTLLGKVKPINPFEAMLMRYIYLKKYSKQI
ncbi:MAG: class II aldolase/adducin family protein [Firmicutes bacterium]|nr:class II aldolase/adducin family protein [Bacillota bacterium]